MENELEIRQLIRECLNILFENHPTVNEKDEITENNNTVLDTLSIIHELNSENQKEE
jgi:hypothetical protein